MNERSSLRDAATVVLLRGTEDFEVFLVKRHGRSGFMAGAHVFPGGTVDDADGQHPVDASGFAARLGLPEDEESRARAFFVAAARETLEESCVLLGSASKDADEVARALNSNMSLGDAEAQFRLRFNVSKLTPLTRWVTPKIEKRRYDTFFFLASVPETQAASWDGHETTEGDWFTPNEALAAFDEGRIWLAPPTHHTLNHLARFDHVESVFDDASSRTPPRLAPVFELRDGQKTLALPGDPAHDATPTLPGPTRYELHDGAWKGFA